MENSAPQIIQQNTVTVTAPVKAAIICLALAWGFAILPIPFISMMGMIVMNIASFILAIICMSRNAVRPGVGVLAGSLIGTPIMYFVGLAVLGAGIASSLSNYNKHVVAAPPVQNNSVPAVQSAKANSVAVPPTIDFAGKWKGQFIYPGKTGTTTADFTMTLNTPGGDLLGGDMSEVDPNTKQSVRSVLSGSAAGNAVNFTQSYGGKSPDGKCVGTYSATNKEITGRCTVLNQHADFSAKQEKISWL